MILLTEAPSPATIAYAAHAVEVSCVFFIDGKVVNRVLRFVVSEEQFKQYQNTAGLGAL